MKCPLIHSKSWLGLAVLLSIAGSSVMASDHDDGENDNKARSLNITDLYMFREDWQSGLSPDRDNLVMIMNTNPRGLPRTQYAYSTNAVYDLNLTRVGSGSAARNSRPTGKNDLRFRLSFGEVKEGKQAITLSALIDGKETKISKTKSDDDILTSTIANAPGSADSVLNNEVELDGKTIKIFAGARQDTFFFDVIGFFKWRAKAAQGATEGLNNLGLLQGDEDFTRNYNVNSIVLSIPRALLGAADIFDGWASISVKTRK